MTNEYRHNHYVPEWYQKKFLSPKQKDDVLYYLDLNPDIAYIDKKGKKYLKNDIHRWGPSKCFAEYDIYTTQLGSIGFTEIEKQFFGSIDLNGLKAVEYFSNFTHPSVDENAFNNLLIYMSIQKIRTPKGLQWLSNQINTNDKNQVLAYMLNIKRMYCAIWTECVWQIADASKSDTKFIISDHPVTVYNRRCGPRSMWCKDASDPDIRYHATQTIFPLSFNKILILTNLSWVRNPYQKETDIRPNPNFFRGAMFNFGEIQTSRYLSEQEVREINFIIKSRAFKYIAASNKDWLYPDKYITKSNWNKYGEGYLLMPDPRAVNYTCEILMGNKDGGITGFDAYGRRPWQQDFGEEEKNGKKDFDTLNKFKGEFANLFGPYRRGRSFAMCRLDNEKDSNEYHQYHLDLFNRKRKKQKK